MGPLTMVAVVLAASAPAPMGQLDQAPWAAFVSEASARFGVPEAWIWRVIQAESAGQTERGGVPITSPKGAMGLMQLMPDTYAAMAAAYGLGGDPYAPRDNILAGTAYLRAMYDRFGYPGLFAAYNAGPARYLAYLERRQPLPLETRAYVAQILRGANGAGDGSGDFAGSASAMAAEASEPKPSPPALFFVRRGNETVPEAASKTGSTGPIFVPLQASQSSPQ